MSRASAASLRAIHLTRSRHRVKVGFHVDADNIGCHDVRNPSRDWRTIRRGRFLRHGIEADNVQLRHDANQTGALPRPLEAR